MGAPVRRCVHVLLLLCGCPNETPPNRSWTQAAAHAGIHQRLDTDRDGRVDGAEYNRTVYAGPPFAQVDINADGGLDLVELQAMLAQQDPLRFDHRREPQGIEVEKWREPFEGDRSVRLQQEFEAFERAVSLSELK